MAINSKDLTIDYRAIQAMPFRDRKALIYSNFADEINSALTPSQRTSLFSNYYLKFAISKPNPNLSKADYLLKKAKEQGVSYSDLNRVSGNPGEKGPPKIAASEFRSVESNPFLAGYVDKAQRDLRSKISVKPQSPEEFFGPNIDVSKLPAGMRNNNPGNLKFNPDVKWEGLVGPSENTDQGDPQAVFNSPLMGMRAAAKLLINKYEKYGLNTFSKIIQTPDVGWTPGASAAQVENAAKQAGFKPDDVLDLDNPEILAKVMRGIIAQEHGASASLYSDDLIKQGIALSSGKEISEERTESAGAPNAMAVVQGVAGETPMASELQPTATEVASVDGGKIKPVSDPLAFMQERNVRAGAEIKNVDPVILKSYSEGIQQFEADNPQYRVEVFGQSGGVRHAGSTRNHGEQENGHGGALDLVIIDRKTGQQLTNFNTPYPGQQGSPGETAPLYAKLHSAAALAQAYYYPDSQQITFGGGFATGDTNFDLMHGDVTHPSGSLGYSWEKGWTPSMLKDYNIPENVAIGSKDEQYALAQKIYGKLDEQGNYSNRLVAVKNEQDNTSKFASAEVKPYTVSASEVKLADNTSNTTTPIVTTATLPPAERASYPTNTMAQGGIIPKSADTQIVQRNMSGDIVSATKVGENENEKMSIEPISKMSADSLTMRSSNPVEENMINSSKSQAESEEKKVSMKSQSIAQPRLSSSPYSNIQGDIKPMSPTALAAMNRARDLSLDRRGYYIKTA